MTESTSYQANSRGCRFSDVGSGTPLTEFAEKGRDERGGPVRGGDRGKPANLAGERGLVRLAEDLTPVGDRRAAATSVQCCGDSCRFDRSAVFAGCDVECGDELFGAGGGFRAQVWLKNQQGVTDFDDTTVQASSNGPPHRRGCSGDVRERVAQI